MWYANYYNWRLAILCVKATVMTSILIPESWVKGDDQNVYQKTWALYLDHRITLVKNINN
jgi:hypothetical protein